jgi:hypothetical protein
MIFPFEVTYKKELKGEIQKYSTSEILDFFKNDFEKSGADSIELTNDCILVKNDWISFRIRPGFNWNRWLGINSAKFQIISTEKNERKAIYTFNLTKLLLESAIICIFIGLVNRSLLVGLVCYFFLGIMNWVIKLFQHQFSFNEFLNERSN